MLWLLYCALFLMMLLSVFRLLQQRGKWAWILFLGLLASAGGFVALMVLGLAGSASLGKHRGWSVLILIGGTLVYLAAVFYFVRKLIPKLSGKEPLP